MIHTLLEESSPIAQANVIPSGSMSHSTPQPNLPENSNTLDEPIKTTIMRDAESIRKKFAYILFPSSDGVQGLSKDWDLWGPSILCLLLSSVLALRAPDSQKGYVFALIYIYVWGGSAIVTFNALLLKGRVSFFQSVCVLGYCILPLVITAVVGLVLDIFCTGDLNKLIRAACVAIALVWSSKASVGFMSELVPEDRRALAVYPVWLLYVAIGWIIVLAGIT